MYPLQKNGNVFIDNGAGSELGKKKKKTGGGKKKKKRERRGEKECYRCLKSPTPVRGEKQKKRRGGRGGGS